VTNEGCGQAIVQVCTCYYWIFGLILLYFNSSYLILSLLFLC